MCWGTNDRDKNQMLDVFADPPLWQGRPELSDAFCNDFIDNSKPIALETDIVP